MNQQTTSSTSILESLKSMTSAIAESGHHPVRQVGHETHRKSENRQNEIP